MSCVLFSGTYWARHTVSPFPGGSREVPLEFVVQDILETFSHAKSDTDILHEELSQRIPPIVNSNIPRNVLKKRAASVHKRSQNIPSLRAKRGTGKAGVTHRPTRFAANVLRRTLAEKAPSDRSFAFGLNVDSPLEDLIDEHLVEGSLAGDYAANPWQSALEEDPTLVPREISFKREPRIFVRYGKIGHLSRRQSLADLEVSQEMVKSLVALSPLPREAAPLTRSVLKSRPTPHSLHASRPQLESEAVVGKGNRFAGPPDPKIPALARQVVRIPDLSSSAPPYDRSRANQSGESETPIGEEIANLDKDTSNVGSISQNSLPSFSAYPFLEDSRESLNDNLTSQPEKSSRPFKTEVSSHRTKSSVSNLAFSPLTLALPSVSENGVSQPIPSQSQAWGAAPSSSPVTGSPVNGAPSVLPSPPPLQLARTLSKAGALTSPTVSPREAVSVLGTVRMDRDLESSLKRTNGYLDLILRPAWSPGLDHWSPVDYSASDQTFRIDRSLVEKGDHLLCARVFEADKIGPRAEVCDNKLVTVANSKEARHLVITKKDVDRSTWLSREKALTVPATFTFFEGGSVAIDHPPTIPHASLRILGMPEYGTFYAEADGAIRIPHVPAHSEFFIEATAAGHYRAIVPVLTQAVEYYIDCNC